MTDQNNENPQELFFDELLAEAGFDEEDNLEVLKEDLKPLLQERVMMHIYKELNEEQTEQITKLLEEDNMDEFDTYIRKNIPNFDDFLMEIYAQFEDEYLENMKNEKK